jgi:hypothetical protein
MIKDKKIWEEFEKKLIKSSKPDYAKNVKIFNLLYEQAIELKAIPVKDPLRGIETKIRIAKFINQSGK